MQEYIFNLSKQTQQYAEVLGRSDASLDDLGLAFRHMNIDLQELAEYAKSVDPIPCGVSVPKLPIHKESHLNFLQPESREVVTRPVHVHEHLPAMYPNTEDEYPRDIKPPEIDSVTSNKVNTSEDEYNENNLFDEHLVERVKITDENRPVREIHSVRMTASDFLPTAREGRLPEARIPQQIRAESPPPKAYSMVPPEAKVEKKIKKNLNQEDGESGNNENKKKKIPKDNLFQPDEIKDVKIKKLAGMKDGINNVKTQDKISGGSPKPVKSGTPLTKTKAKKLVVEQNTESPFSNKRKAETIDKLPIEPDKQNLNSFKKISSKRKKDKERESDLQHKLKEMASRENSPTLPAGDNLLHRKDIIKQLSSDSLNEVISLDRPKTPTIEKDMDSQSSQFSSTRGSIIPPHIPYPMFPTRFQSGPGLIPHPNSPAAIRESGLRPPLDGGRPPFVPPSFVDEPMSMVPSFPFKQHQQVQQPIKKQRRTSPDKEFPTLKPTLSTYPVPEAAAPPWMLDTAGSITPSLMPTTILPVTSEEHKKEKKEKMKKKKEKKEKHKDREEKIKDQKDKSEKKDKLDKIKKKKEKKEKRKEKEASQKLAKEEKLVSLDRPKTPTIEKDTDSQSSQFSPTRGSIIPRHIPYAMFPTRFQSGPGLIPHPNSPAAIPESGLRPPLDGDRPPFVPPSFVDEPTSMMPSFPFKQPQQVQQPIKKQRSTSPDKEFPTLKPTLSTYPMPEAAAPPSMLNTAESITPSFMSTTILPVTSEEHKKEKKEKMKKKKEKKEKHKDRGEKIQDQKDKSEKRDELDKIKKKKEKRKEKEASKKLPKEETLVQGVNKISIKLGLAEDLPLFTPDSALTKKIKPLKKREPTPELARISALATRPPKQKSTKAKSEAVPIKKVTEEDKENGGNSLTVKLGVTVDSSGRTVWFCPTCGEKDNGSPMIACDDCDAWYHWVCVGIQVAPAEDVDWYCRSCTAKKH